VRRRLRRLILSDGPVLGWEKGSSTSGRLNSLFGESERVFCSPVLSAIACRTGGTGRLLVIGGVIPPVR
jgi:hypothetical protein